MNVYKHTLYSLTLNIAASITVNACKMQCLGMLPKIPSSTIRNIITINEDIFLK